MSRAEKKQRAKERAERALQREAEQNGYEYEEYVRLMAAKTAAAKHKKTSNGKLFIKTFLIAFVLFAGIGIGATTVIDKIANYNPFDVGGERSPILEEELKLDSLIAEESGFSQTFKEANRANVLLLGVNDGLTDTIMLVSFDMDNKKVDVISVPRDTYYKRKGYNGAAELKLNAAYKGNPVNTAKAVSEILCGMPINYYAVIEYEGVENIVDAMDGVPMEIPDINGKGGMYYTDPYDTPPLKIAIPAGYQVLDGEHAVQFLRFRKGYVEGDLGRVKAQQEFVKSAFKQCLSFNLPTIAKTVFENVDSDISLGTALSLATKAIGISGEDITTYTIPNYPDPDPPYYVYPDEDKVEEMIRMIYDPESVQTETDGTEDGSTESAQ